MWMSRRRWRMEWISESYGETALGCERQHNRPSGFHPHHEKTEIMIARKGGSWIFLVRGWQNSIMKNITHKFSISLRGANTVDNNTERLRWDLH